MEPYISNEEVEAIQVYLRRATNHELEEPYKFATYSSEELTVIFPAIQKLLLYKQTLKQQSGSGGYVKTDLWAPSENNPRRTLLLVMRHTIPLQELLVAYQTARNATTFLEQRMSFNRLYTMDISTMSPIEYDQFKKLIGG